MMNKTFNTIISFSLGKSYSKGIDTGLFILRLILGAFMLTHGIQKLTAFDLLKTSFPDPIGLGSSLSLILIIFAEFGCSVLILLGALTRLSLLPLMFGMIVAAFITHGYDGFSVQELPLMYLCMYLILFITGPGKYALDTIFRRYYNKKKKNLL